MFALATYALSKRFGRVRVLDRLDLTVEPGEIYGFLGRNGAGKTTTIQCVMGILSPDAGTVEILGQRTRRPTIRLKRSIGYVSQEQNLYEWMTCRSIGRFASAFYPSWDRAEYRRLLHVLDLPPRRRVSRLSAGMRRKLGLALALAHHPELLVLDEPTAGLDPLARREFLTMIHQHARAHGRTTFFSSHRIDEVEEFADRVGILDRGRLAFEGELTELRAEVREVPEDLGDTARSVGLELVHTERRRGAPRLRFRGPPAAWDALPQERVTLLSLEDLFIALATHKVVEL